MRRVPLLTTLDLSTVLALTQAQAQCVSRPAAFNGRMAISSPLGGSASVVQLCDAQAARLRQEVLDQGRATGVDVRWAEYYAVRGWVSTFRDLIYKTGSRSSNRVAYKQFNLTSWKDVETLMSAGPGGKYVGKIYRKLDSSGSSGLFMLYGN